MQRNLADIPFMSVLKEVCQVNGCNTLRTACRKRRIWFTIKPWGSVPQLFPRNTEIVTLTRIVAVEFGDVLTQGIARQAGSYHDQHHNLLHGFLRESLF